MDAVSSGAAEVVGSSVVKLGKELGDLHCQSYYNAGVLPALILFMNVFFRSLTNSGENSILWPETHEQFLK